MKLSKLLAAAMLLLSVTAGTALADDVKIKLSLEEARNHPSVRPVLDGDIAFFWGDDSNFTVQERLGTFQTSKRTNGFLKEEYEACGHALASALISLQERARQEGGNAVINLVSNIQNIQESSTTEYSCLVGTLMVNVALRGTVVNLSR